MTPEATPMDAVHIIGRMAGCVGTAGVLAVDECRTVCRASCCVKDKTGLTRRGPVAFMVECRSKMLAKRNDCQETLLCHTRLRCSRLNRGSTLLGVYLIDD